MSIHRPVLSALATIMVSVTAAVAAPEFREMTFEAVSNGGNCDGCGWIAAQGDITSATPGRLREFLRDNHAGMIVFDSPGGEVVPSLEVGTIIREAGASTSIGRTVREAGGWYAREPGTCVSACAFAFLGGVSRQLEAGELGVHQFYNMISLSKPSDPIYSALDLSEAQIISSLLIGYAVEMDVDPRVIAKASSVAPGDMYYLTEEDVRLWRLRYDPSVLGEWRIKPRDNGIVAEATSVDEQTTVSIFCTASAVPLMMIFDMIDYPEGTFTDPASYIERISVFGLPVEPSSVLTLYEDGKYTLMMRLPDHFLALLPAEGTIGIDVDIARAYAALFDYPMQATGAREHIGAALRNCL